MTERRVLIASLLSVLFFVWYAPLVAKRVPSQTTPLRPVSSPAPSSTTGLPDEQAHAARTVTIQSLTTENTAMLESPDLLVEIGLSTANVRNVTLKKFFTNHHGEHLSFGREWPVLAMRPAQETLAWKLERNDSHSIELSATGNKGISYHISYTVDSHNPLLNIVLDTKYPSEDIGNEPSPRLIATWERADSLSNRYNSLEFIALGLDEKGAKKYTRYLAPPRNEKIVPRGTHMVALSERFFCQIVRQDGSHGIATLLTSSAGEVAAELELLPVNQQEGKRAASATVYFGPRDYFYLSSAGFEQAFPIGTLGKIGLVLLLVLKWLAGIIGNYGVAIIVFSGLITGVMAPFTLLGIRSMKKMQELKPQMDRITEKHKDNPQKANQEVLALYREHKVSPLSGCLPMLLQMPIFIALFQAISHFVGLRGAKFLWITDLSLPDRIARLPISLPLLGRDLNLLPIIMAGAMYVQTKLSQKNTPVDRNNPTAAMMSGPLMSIVFGIMFYQFPSGLVLYWLTNSVFSLALYTFGGVTTTSASK